MDSDTFRCLELAYRAGKEGGLATAVLNAANEVAVAAFLEGGIDFLGIERVVEITLDRYEPQPMDSLQAVMRAEEWARSTAEDSLRKVG